jgi:plastocyanin
MEDRPRAGGPGGRGLRVWLAGAVWLVLLAGCGGTGDQDSGAAATTARFREGMEGLQGGVQRGAPVVVTMTDKLRFGTDRVTVPVGATVLWRNDSSVAHTVTADPARARTASNVQLPSGAEPFESESLPQGQTFARQVTVPGEYRYVCRIHEESGMAGIVTAE